MLMLLETGGNNLTCSVNMFLTRSLPPLAELRWGLLLIFNPNGYTMRVLNNLSRIIELEKSIHVDQYRMQNLYYLVSTEASTCLVEWEEF